MIVSDVTMPVNQRRRSMGFRGLCFRPRILPTVLRPWQGNDITKLGEAAMSSIALPRAVAAATGRRFKSCHPDQ